MMVGLFDDTMMEIPCPKCEQPHFQTIAWLKVNDEILCGCGATIVLDKENFNEPLEEVDNALAELERAFSKIGK